MIRKIKVKFVVLSMTALFVLLSVIVAGMNLINYNAVVTDADETLALLSGNRGKFPDFETFEDFSRPEFPKNMNLETPYESRYFSVLLDENHSVIQADTSRIKAIDTETAIDYAASAIARGRSSGFIRAYRFMCHSEGDFLRITFLDCGRKLDSFQTFLAASICMALTGYLLFFVVILFFSERIVRPVTESYEKQKQFITDAGHELKTPLSIIQADVDVLEMDLGENEWLSDIQKQTRRLAELTQSLVYLSRMEEAENGMPMIEFPFSDVVEEAAASYQAPAQTQHKNYHCQVQPMLSLTGNEKAIRQLVGILLDNALKYSPEGGDITVTVKKQGRSLLLSVANTTYAPIPKEALERLFERFYRLDSSRSSQTGGYGIGLSVAKAIVTAHGGKVSAASEGTALEITAVFPLQ